MTAFVKKINPNSVTIVTGRIRSRVENSLFWPVFSIQLKCQEHDLPLSTVGLFSSTNNHVFCTISLDIIVQNKMHCS